MESDLSLFLGNKDKIRPFEHKSVLSDGAYLSYGEFIKIFFRTGDLPAGRGFKARYKTGKNLTVCLFSNLSREIYYRYIKYCRYKLTTEEVFHFIIDFIRIYEFKKKKIKFYRNV